MNTTPIRSPAGIARPLRSGGYAIDFGDPFPVIVPDRDHAYRELRSRLNSTREP